MQNISKSRNTRDTCFAVQSRARLWTNNSHAVQGVRISSRICLAIMLRRAAAASLSEYSE